jgi:metacaspase-1
MDFEANGHIVDDVSLVVVHCAQSNSIFKLMHEIMVKPLPAGCRLTAIFDASLQK